MINRIMYAARKFFILAALTGPALVNSIPAAAEPSPAHWYLPQEIDDRNISIRFEVDSTWHTVHGKTAGAHGSAGPSDGAANGGLKIDIALPVAKFDTDNSSRDEELRNIMAAQTFPEVHFTASNAGLECTPARAREQGACNDTLRGSLTIRSTSKPVEIPIVIRGEADRFIVSGDFPIRWADFEVEDPSIFLVASVDPIVHIHFETVLAARDVSAAERSR